MPPVTPSCFLQFFEESSRSPRELLFPSAAVRFFYLGGEISVEVFLGGKSLADETARVRRRESRVDLGQALWSFRQSSTGTLGLLRRRLIVL